jgi:PAP2 superfamily
MVKSFFNISFFLILITHLFAQTDEQAASQFIKSAFHLSEVMLHDVASPPAAARFYAYSILSAYEVLQRNQPEMLALSKNFHVAPDFAKLNLPTKFNPAFSATYAMLETGRLILPSGYMLEAKQLELIKIFQKNYKLKTKDIEANQQYAKQVAAQIVAYAKKDGYFSLSILPRYKPNTKETGRWYPTPPEYMSAVEPQWKTIRTFFLDSADQFAPDPPAPFSTEKGSSFFTQLEEVVSVSRQLTAEQKAIAGFWDCNPFAVTYSGHAAMGVKKISPGGHWIGITGIVCRKANASLQKTITAHALVALSLHDAFVSCWYEKYHSDRIRPESAINKYVDEAWRPLLQTPPFPEYTSGHSVISTASAEVLSYFFGENFEYVDTSEEYFGLPARSFKSFRAASQEAAISRLYGGIHFRDAIEAGQRQGEAIGKYIVKKSKNLKTSR